MPANVFQALKEMQGAMELDRLPKKEILALVKENKITLFIKANLN
jgi:hypothetical protein